MARIERFEELKAWRHARLACKAVYATTRQGEFAKNWGLRDQNRRSSESMMSNIAEGFAAGGDTEFIRFLRYAHRSGEECKSQLHIAGFIRYLRQD